MKWEALRARVSKSQLSSNVLGLAVILIVFGLANREFLTSKNFASVLLGYSMIGIAAFGQTSVMIAGSIDLSIGSIADLAAITAGWLMDKTTINPYLLLVVGVMVGVASGAINGIVVAKLKIAPFIATLGMMEVYFGIVMVITHGLSIFTIPRQVQNVASLKLGGIAIPIWVFLVIAALSAWALRKTNVGRNVFAVGGNARAAEVCGISVARTQFFVHIFSGTLAGIGGVLSLSWLGSGQPTIGNDWLIPTVAATIIGGTSLTGGRGSIVGTLTGVFLLGFLDNGLTMANTSPYWRGGVTGIVLILAVLVDVLRRRNQQQGR